MFALLCGLALGAFANWIFGTQLRTAVAQPVAAVAKEEPMHPSLADLSAMSDEELSHVDIGLMNLVCAEGLPRTGKNTLKDSVAELDGMVAAVRIQTARNEHQWREHPAEFENSEAYYRVAMLATVLAQDFGVRYNPALIAPVTMESMRDTSCYNNADDVFISGCLDAKHEGTCSSMPVLATAVGRRLGYPMKLVCAKGHLFCRWEDGKEKRNFEYMNGVVCSPDDYYRKWPFPITEWEEKQGWYLVSLTPRQELAVFMSMRGAVLNQHKDYGKALLANTHATMLWPGHRDQGFGLVVSAEAWLREQGFSPRIKTEFAGQQSAFDPEAERHRVEALNAANQRASSASRSSPRPPFGTPNSFQPQPFRP